MAFKSKPTFINTNSGRQVAASYLRMSTESQNYSLHHQEQALKQYADVNKIDIVKRYVDAGTHLPAAETYRYRFGSLTAAYRHAGISNERAANAVLAKRRIQDLRMALYVDFTRYAREAGATSDAHNGRQEVLINNRLLVRLYVARGRPYKSGRCRWIVPCELAVDTDFVVVAQMLPANTDLRRFYLFSSRSLGNQNLVLREEDAEAFAGNAFETLRSVFGLSEERA